MSRHTEWDLECKIYIGKMFVTKLIGSEGTVLTVGMYTVFLFVDHNGSENFNGKSLDTLVVGPTP